MQECKKFRLTIMPVTDMGIKKRFLDKLIFNAVKNKIHLKIIMHNMQIKC